LSLVAFGGSADIGELTGEGECPTGTHTIAVPTTSIAW
jgi:hypothetical protein